MRGRRVYQSRFDGCSFEKDKRHMSWLPFDLDMLRSKRATQYETAAFVFDKTQDINVTAVSFIMMRALEVEKSLLDIGAVLVNNIGRSQFDFEKHTK